MSTALGEVFTNKGRLSLFKYSVAQGMHSIAFQFEQLVPFGLQSIQTKSCVGDHWNDVVVGPDGRVLQRIVEAI